MNTNELKAARVRRGLTQKDIAAKLGWTVPSYCMKEKGRRSMSVYDINKISQALKLPSRRKSIFFATKC